MGDAGTRGFCSAEQNVVCGFDWIVTRRAGQVVGWARASNQPCGGNLDFLGVHPRKSQF